MKRLFLCVLLGILCASQGYTNNIRIDSVSYDPMKIGGQTGTTRLTMKFLVVWENSWRDDYNYDAAYVFFKFKKKVEGTSTAEPWQHLFLAKDGHQIVGDDRANYDFWLSPLSESGTDFNTGVYIYRKNKGVFPKDSVWMEVTWDIVKQMASPQLKPEDLQLGQVQVAGHALEMIYVPRGAYRIGDGVSNKTFRKQAFPLLSEYDIVSKNYNITASGSGDPKLAADRINDNTQNSLSVWQPGQAEVWWQIDYGQGNKKKITYFGVNGYKYSPNNYPTTFELKATTDPNVATPVWVSLWSGPGKEYWTMAHDAYPIEKAIRIEKPGEYRVYRLEVHGMNNGLPMVTSIGMTEANLDALIDYSCLIDSTATVVDTLRKFGASDGSVWTTGSVIPSSFPNGYSGFYAMKYELTQDQYVRFLNKLTYLQQDGLLSGRLAGLKEGEYIFGDPSKTDQRNGIVLVSKIEGMPASFACDLDRNTPPGQEGDGQDVACNFMNINDMLAYADWACLRPLSEMEYEKMCRSLYPEIPERKSFAWGTQRLLPPGEVSDWSKPQEHAASGNANWGNKLIGPLRVGAFASRGNASREKSGAGYWGAMDLSGNLAEIYYNVNGCGLTLVDEVASGELTLPTAHLTGHGDGSLATNGSYNGVKTMQWAIEPAKFGIRGGSFASDTAELVVSDRTHATDYFDNIWDRDSSVTFRLGRTAPKYPQITSWLITESEVSTEGASRSDFFLHSSSYLIKGNKPENPQGGAISYIWYNAESGGDWKVMEGQINQELYFDKYRNDSIAKNTNSLNFKFKRKAITPFTDSETSSNYIVSLIANPFDEEVEWFNYSSDSHTVACDWDPTIPRKWAFEQSYPGLTIDEKTGVISGLNNTICNVSVTLECTLYPGIIYKKLVKERHRDFTCTKAQQTIKLLPGAYQLECWGAQGGNDPLYSSTNIGGRGGYASGILNLVQNVTLYIYVGGQGSGSSSGSSWHSTGGGGATDIRLVSGSGNWKDNAGLYSRIIVAGGGGGRHGSNYEGITILGNDGGGLSAPTFKTNGYTIAGGSQTGGGSSNYGSSVKTGAFGFANITGQSNSYSLGGYNGGGAGSDNWANGGAGGGWYGGCASWPTGSGGSSYVLTSTSVKPSGYTPTSAYWMNNAITYSGNASMPNYAKDNTTMVGNRGNGYARISVK